MSIIENNEQQKINQILVLDIETTGLNPLQHHIVEIGGVILDFPGGVITDRVHYLIHENGFNEHAWIFNNSDLTPAEVKTGVTLESIREELQKLFDDHICVAYSAAFDFGFLQARGFRIDRRGPDPMLLATDVLKIPNYRGFKWPKVQECLDYFQICENEPHRALSDTRLEAKIVYELYKRNVFRMEGLEPYPQPKATIEFNDWRDPPSQFVPNQENWCYGCNNFDGTNEIPMTKAYPVACKKCNFLSEVDRP